MKLLITGGAGFIGSAVTRHLINDLGLEVVNVDKLTYAGNTESLKDVLDSDKYTFEKIDICDAEEVKRLFSLYQPDRVMHLAAESHVDRSIYGPAEFVQTNLVGTYVMLEAARQYWSKLSYQQQSEFRFHHISTDEVYGDIENLNDLYVTNTSYAPSSPYSASKAGSDHLVRAWHRTYGLPTLITNCSNNYGPRQFPEKLIPLIILNALAGKPLPVYGKGNQVRDWLYVEDHVDALWQVLTKGKIGEVYSIGSNNEISNIEVVKIVCRTLDDLVDSHPVGICKFEELITFVEDRPGHDQRYASGSSKIRQELGWSPKESFATGIHKTVQWYLANPGWYKKG